MNWKEKYEQETGEFARIQDAFHYFYSDAYVRWLYKQLEQISQERLELKRILGEEDKI